MSIKFVRTKEEIKKKILNKRSHALQNCENNSRNCAQKSNEIKYIKWTSIFIPRLIIRFDVLVNIIITQ